MQEVHFFEMGQVGFPVLVVTLLYFATIGYKRIVNTTVYMEDIKIKTPNTEDGTGSGEKLTSKMIISIMIFFLCVVGFITGLWTEGGVAVTGAMLCIIFGCIEANDAFRSVSWTAIVVIGGALGVGVALTNSGATIT